MVSLSINVGHLSNRKPVAKQGLDVGGIRELRPELSRHDHAVEIQKSDSLVEAESQLAQKVVNAAAVEVSLRNQTKESEVLHECQRPETQDQLLHHTPPVGRE